MKTIAIDIRLIGRNRTGDEAVFRNLVRTVLELDRTSRYLLLTDRNDPESLTHIRTAVGTDGRLPDNAEIVALEARGRFAWNLFVIPYYLSRVRVDVFHTQYILPAFVPRRTKVVTHIHDVSFKAFPNYIGTMDRWFLSMFMPRTMRRSDRLIVPSAFTRDEIVTRYGVSSDRIAIVPNSVDPGFLVKPTTDDFSRVRSSYGLPASFVLSVGTMQPRKNIPVLVHAFARVRERLPELKLVLVGGKGGHGYDERIDDVIREERLEEAVIFPGYVRQGDMPSVYACAKALVFPSRYEGFGIPLLEAFSVGTPVVASEIGPFREVGGDAVSYFDPTNIAACAESLYTLLIDENARQRHERLGKDRLRGYSWVNSARALLCCYGSFFESKS